MRTIRADEFDYQDYMRNSTPEGRTAFRGPKARQARRAGLKERITIRIDRDVLDQFKVIAPHGQGYQRLINEALRDWLSARGVRELIRDELQTMTKQVVASVKAKKLVEGRVNPAKAKKLLQGKGDAAKAKKRLGAKAKSAKLVPTRRRAQEKGNSQQRVK